MWQRVLGKLAGIGLIFLGLIILLTQQLNGWMVINVDTDPIILSVLMVVVIAGGFACLGGNPNDRFWLFVNAFAWCFILPFVLGGFTMNAFILTGSQLGIEMDLGPFGPIDLTFLQIFVTWLIPIAVLIAALVSIKIVATAFDRNFILGTVLALIVYTFIVATFVH